MHVPKHFQQHDVELHQTLIRDYPLATLVTQSSNGLDACHVPVVLKNVIGKQLIKAHIAKANRLWKEVSEGAEVLLIFNGPNCYVSPNYYPTKKETGKAVPTWNYVVLHVRGVIRFEHDREWLKALVDQLTKEHEASQPSPWSTADAPESYIERMLAGIVGIEIDVRSMEAQWKLSQNQPEKNRLGVIEGLSSKTEKDYQAIASLVKQQSR